MSSLETAASINGTSVTSQIPATDSGPDWHRYAAMLRAARERLTNLRVDDPAIPACVAGLARIEGMLRPPLRIAVLGEYNSGKTSVTGLIIGKGLLPVSVISNTGVPVLVGYGDEPALYGVNADGISIRIDGPDDDPLTDLDYRAVDIRLPLPWLQFHQILDTPATLTPALFAADADITIWCTVATRAWTESERNLWSSMPQRCLNTALLVATHKDSFFSDEDCDQVLRRLKAMSTGLFRDALLISSAAPEPGNGTGHSSASGETAAIRAAIEGSAVLIRNRRLLKARRIVERLARLSLHEFGRNAVTPQSQITLHHWQLVTDRILQDYAAGRLTLDRTIRKLIHDFAHAAEDLRPGVIGPSSTPQRAGIPLTTATPLHPTTHRPSMLRADLTAVLRVLASRSRFEPPDAREQREAARSTLMALADLDGIFGRLSQWLAVPAPAAERKVHELNA